MVGKIARHSSGQTRSRDIITIADKRSDWTHSTCDEWTLILYWSSHVATIMVIPAFKLSKKIMIHQPPHNKWSLGALDFSGGFLKLCAKCEFSSGLSKRIVPIFDKIEFENEYRLFLFIIEIRQGVFDIKSERGKPAQPKNLSET